MEANNNPLVCFFDSGIGGLNLLYECVRKLPRVDFIYFADNYRVPYGNLRKSEIMKYTEETFDKINKLNPAAAVTACNTVTAQCIDALRQKYGFDIIGIQPAVKPAAATGGKCVVLATEATARSNALKKLTEEYGNAETVTVACADLAGYIENNIFDLSYKEAEKLLPDIKADSVVLGCTHYIFIKKFIEKRYNCPVFDGIEGTSERLRSKLGIFAHQAARAQKIRFFDGDYNKNRRVFNLILRQKGFQSLKINK